MCMKLLAFMSRLFFCFCLCLCLYTCLSHNQSARFNAVEDVGVWVYEISYTKGNNTDFI